MALAYRTQQNGSQSPWLVVRRSGSAIVMSKWGIWTKTAKLRELNSWKRECEAGLDQYIYSLKLKINNKNFVFVINFHQIVCFGKSCFWISSLFLDLTFVFGSTY